MSRDDIQRRIARLRVVELDPAARGENDEGENYSHEEGRFSHHGTCAAPAERMTRNHSLRALACAVGLSACATTSQPPTNALADSQASVRVAEQNGADGDPGAARYLNIARRQIADAELLIHDGNNATAGRILDEARGNADMAVELSRQAALRADAVQTQRQIDDLRARRTTP